MCIESFSLHIYRFFLLDFHASCRKFPEVPTRWRRSTANFPSLAVQEQDAADVISVALMSGSAVRYDTCLHPGVCESMSNKETPAEWPRLKCQCFCAGSESLNPAYPVANT